MAIPDRSLLEPSFQLPFSSSLPKSLYSALKILPLQNLPTRPVLPFSQFFFLSTFLPLPLLLYSLLRNVSIPQPPAWQGGDPCHTSHACSLVFEEAAPPLLQDAASSSRDGKKKENKKPFSTKGSTDIKLF